MPDDITDVYIATEAGDAGWQSLSALAAAQVEPELPISSSDGTVTLDSPSADTFTISTGSSTPVIIDKDHSEFKNDIQAGRIVGPAPDSDASIEIGATATINSKSGLLVKTKGFGSPRLYIQDAYSQFNGPLRVSAGTAAAPGLRGSKEATGFCVCLNGSDVISASINGVTAMSLEATSNAFINVAKIQGSLKPATDASIELGATATVNAAGGLVVKNDDLSTATMFVQSEYAQFSSPLWVASGDVSAPGIRSSNASTGICIGESGNDTVSVSLNGVRYVNLTNNETAFLNVAKIVGSKNPSTDAFIELDPNFKISTTDTAKIVRSDGSPYQATAQNSIATKQTVDDKIWVGNTAQYNAISQKNPATLYCLTD